MKYELFTTLTTGFQLPPWAPGFDRLTYFSPYPHRREMTEQDIANGSMSRYVEDGDHVVYGEEFDEIHTIYITLAAAERDRDYNVDLPMVISAVIIERPDL
jgi:hypothetical protein